MKGDKEFYGKLRGFDDYLNMILDDVSEFAYAGSGGKGRVIESRHKSMLLNGAHVCMMIPGENQELEKMLQETDQGNKKVDEETKMAAAVGQ